jgi:hypothetical protein
MKTLDSQRLNVVNQARSNIFGWHSQFTLEFVARDLREARILRYTVRPGRSDVEGCDDSGVVYRVEIALNGLKHTAVRRKRIATGQFRVNGKPQAFQHGEVCRCRKFRQLIDW